MTHKHDYNVDTSIDWVHYLTRPFTLFGASLWQSWYESPLLEELIGVNMPSVLFLEEHTRVARSYRDNEELDAMRGAVVDMADKDEEKLASIFERGEQMNDRARKLLNSGKEGKFDLEEAVAFMIELAIYATVIPNMSLPSLADLGKEKGKIFAHGEKLRGISFYPQIIDKVVMPLAHNEVKKEVAHLAVDDVNFLTLDEIKASEVDGLENRRGLSDQGLRYIYQIVNSEKSVEYVMSVQPLVMDLEGMSSENAGNIDELRGRTAWPGKVRGTARLILNNTGQGSRFDSGDILVSINSSPTMMPIILKSSAIVTDEGGVACHAAIVSRELKKPCVMGTKLATSMIKDGDEIEVDATSGVVRVIKRN